jgi:uncharacterized protein YkwD
MYTKLRTCLLIASLLLSGFTPAFAFAQSSSTSVSVDVELRSSIVALTNTDRSTSSLSPLTENAALTAAAQKKADDMLARGYFAHVSPQGGTPWQWFHASGYSYIYAGENLAMNFYTASDVEAAWMNSPTHRANIVDAHYKEMGIGIARGTYMGNPVIFIVEFFGTSSQTAQSSKVRTLTKR